MCKKYSIEYWLSGEGSKKGVAAAHVTVPPCGRCEVDAAAFAGGSTKEGPPRGLVLTPNWREEAGDSVCCCFSWDTVVLAAASKDGLVTERLS